VADPSFCDIPIIIRDDMPVGCMVVVTENGKQVIPIVNLDIEVCGNLQPGPPQIEYGSRTSPGGDLPISRTRSFTPVSSAA
jgi:hypothetical protein